MFLLMLYKCTWTVIVMMQRDHFDFQFTLYVVAFLFKQIFQRIVQVTDTVGWFIFFHMGALWSLFVLSIGVFSCNSEYILRKLHLLVVELYPTLQRDQY